MSQMTISPVGRAARRSLAYFKIKKEQLQKCSGSFLNS